METIRLLNSLCSLLIAIFLYKCLLLKFKEITNCPILVNTSFNVRGEPPVNTPIDAYKCFMATDLDILIVGKPSAEDKAAIALVMVMEFGFAAIKPYITEVLKISDKDMKEFMKLFIEGRNLGLKKLKKK